MLTAFWSGLGADLAKRWAARVLTPAFAFWAGGIVAVWWGTHGQGVREHGWAHELSAASAWLRVLPGFAQAVLIAAGLLLLTASALLGERLTVPLLQFLEGYWRRPRIIRDALIGHRRARQHRWAKRVDELATRQLTGALSLAQFVELRRLEASPPPDTTRLSALRKLRALGLDAQQTAELGQGRVFLRLTPRSDDLGMPTRLGDLLRAAERRPYDKYGLDAVVCWYALWLVLPSDVKSELVGTRTALDNAARGWLWGALFAVWTPWNWWALAVAVIVASLTYYGGILPAASQFGELMVTAFDLYRFTLYDSLHLPRPASPVLERQVAGPRVNNLLWGGLDEPGLNYVEPG